MSAVADRDHPSDSLIALIERLEHSVAEGERETLSAQFPSFDLSILTDKQLAVLELRICRGCTWREIAALLECRSDNAVRTRFARAAAHLRKLGRPGCADGG